MKNNTLKNYIPFSSKVVSEFILSVSSIHNSKVCIVSALTASSKKFTLRIIFNFSIMHIIKNHT